MQCKSSSWEKEPNGLEIPKILTATDCDRARGVSYMRRRSRGGMMIFTFNNIKGNKVMILPVMESVTRPNMGILCRMALLKSEE